MLPGCEVLAGLEKDEQREFRKLVIGAILGTDMTHHKAILARVKTKLDEKTGALSETNYNPNDLEDRVLLARSPSPTSLGDTCTPRCFRLCGVRPCGPAVSLSHLRRRPASRARRLRRAGDVHPPLGGPEQPARAAGGVEADGARGVAGV